MELTLYMAYAGDHIGYTLEEKPGLILKDIVKIEEITLYMNMYNPKTQGTNGGNI